MELVKKQLEENGYAYFNMKDYDMFTDDLKNFSKYICNETNNLKKYINSIRVDVIAKDEFKHEFANGKMQIQKEFDSFEKAKLAMIEADSKMNIDKHSFQKWFFGHGSDVNFQFQSLSTKIVKNIYDINPTDKLSHNASLTYYEPGCFLRKHQDGYTSNRLCVVLIYLNDSDYKPEWGGNLTFNDSNTIAPLYGNVAILDFKSHNAFHEVKKVTDGYGRYAFLDFISIEDVN
jgi:Rps23 Pro-64 3,4-dihydroxylase Tpa1-like proline 4-hydroxylase